MEIKEVATTDEYAKDFEIDGILKLHIKRNDCGYSFDVLSHNGDTIDGIAVDVEVNKFGVPYQTFEIALADGTSRVIDIGNEEDCGDIQHCVPGDCDDWKTAIGWGNDADGHTKIVWVDGYGDRVNDWYNECVKCWVDKYSE